MRSVEVIETPRTARVTYHVTGLDCAEEVTALQAAVRPLPGILDLQFDVLSGRMTVTYDEQRAKPADMEAAVARTGMRARQWQSAAVRLSDEGAGWQRWGRTVTTGISGALVLLGFLLHGLAAGWLVAIGGHESAMPLLPRLCYLGAALSGSWFVLPKAWRALRRLRPDMNLLMTVAVIGAILIGEYFEAATVTFLFALSLALESWSVGRARRAVAALLKLSPPTARIVDAQGGEHTVPVEAVPVGAHIVVRPGERIPLDGRVINGESHVNQAPITGESAPVEKVTGSDVFAGSINGDGALEFESTKPAADTTLAHIIRLVEQAQQERAPAEQWVERFARWYTPTVMALAVMVMIVPPLLAGGSWSGWFYQGLVLLVVACPCALVISTPVSIVAGLTAAARAGVLVKGGLHLEQASRVRVIALDKTGTLTAGHPQVETVAPLANHTAREIAAMAAAIEARSEHPLARAIVRHAESLGFRPSPADRFQALKGKGATAMLAGRPVWIGSHLLLEERGQETTAMHEQLERLSGGGTSVVVVGRDDHVCGFIAVADRVRPESADAVAALRAAGIERVVMLTGDNQATAERIGELVGLDEVRAELLPEAKVAAVEELVESYGTVAMIGDGVNDAPALARASLGIAMGAIGSDAAIETADVALMSDDLSRLPWLVRHARRTLRIIRQNIAASLAVKSAFVVLAFSGHASLWAAIAADMGVSLLVVFNALRLLNGHTVGSPRSPSPESKVRAQAEGENS
jgi:Cd2+/Zn2+-exporting ATPase